jgi:hypothetical protein
VQAPSSFALRLGRIANTAYGLVAVLAALALWGWVVDVPALRDLGAQAAPMPPAAALALLLIAGGFTARQRGQRRSALAAACVAVAIAGLTLVEEFARVPLGMQIEWLAPARAARRHAQACAPPTG